MAVRPKTATLSRSMCVSSLVGEVRSDSDDSNPDISLKDFLDFLCIAYQVAEAIDGMPNDISNKAGVDWSQLTGNPLVNRLLELEDITLPESQTQTSSQALHSSDINNSVNNIQNLISNDKRKNLTSFQRMQSISIDCLRNAEDKIVPKSPMPLERRLSTGSVVLNNDFPLNTSLLEQLHPNINLSPLPPSEPVTAESLMKCKLNEVLQEGILDSVLPYLVPKQVPTISISSSQTLATSSSDVRKNSLQDKTCNNNNQSNEITDRGRQRPQSSTDNSKPDLEVEIHVCDEVKSLKKDFRCPQRLLVSKMGYFAEVTTGQKLEDMDISVHCDLSIFDWLMRWVKKDLNAHDNPPSLDSSNVVPILVSAAFLQMEPLMQDCLRFCHKNMNSILRTSTNLACLNDSILTKLANLYCNSDVELLRDKKDRIQSRLYCKLISVLAEPKADTRRGHYASLSALFKCSRCLKLILRQLGGRIACKPGSSRLDRNGCLHGNHSREASWNLSEYIKSLRSELKSWRRVYWRLWGDCHFQYCSLCHSHFPAYQRNWCLYHTDPPQFFSIENQRALSYPIGRYPCCGEKAFRFEVVRNSTGCQFRAHQPVLINPIDSEVERIFQAHSSIIACDPPALLHPDRISRLVSSSSRDPDESAAAVGRVRDKERDAAGAGAGAGHWWDGLELAPARSRHGLLGRVWDSYQQRLTRPISPVGADTSTSAPPPKTTIIKKQMSMVEAGSANPGNVAVVNSLDHDTSSEVTSSESEELSDDNSEESCPTRLRTVRSRRRRPGPRQPRALTTRPIEMGPQWIAKLSTRNNQDNQRECEERAVRHMTALLTRRTSGVSGSAVGGHHRSSHHQHHHQHHHHHSMWNCHYTPPGGTFVRIEAEWREQHAVGASSGSRARPTTSTHLTRQKSKSGR